MPRLALDIGFCQELHKLEKKAKNGVFDLWKKFEELSLPQLMAEGSGVRLEQLKSARDPHIRTVRIDRFWRGVVLAPETGELFVLLKVLPHDDAIAWAKKQRASINTVTRAVEIRDVGTLDALAPATEHLAIGPPGHRLFDHLPDKALASLGIDEDTLRRAMSLTDKEQLELSAPYLPPDQCEVLQYLAEGFTVEEVWRDIVATGFRRQRPGRSIRPTTRPRSGTRDPGSHWSRPGGAAGHPGEAIRRLARLPPSHTAPGRLPHQLLGPRTGLRRSGNRQDRRCAAPGPVSARAPARRGRILLTSYTNALVVALRSG
nr:coiled-coil domain-containing family 124 protein [Streptomyces sp. YIM 98790]